MNMYTISESYEVRKNRKKRRTECGITYLNNEIKKLLQELIILLNIYMIIGYNYYYLSEDFLFEIYSE